jgi:GNAT superfamily N-acetyltransferase
LGGRLALVALGPSDAGELLTLQRAAYMTEAAAHSDFNIPPLTQTLADLAAELGRSNVAALGIRDDGRLIGSVRLRRSGTVAELGRLVVAPDRQGEGLGTWLLRHAEAVFPAVCEIRLFTGENSLANPRLYARCGYRETGRSSAGHYQLVHLAKQVADD